jgi:NAD(P)-dependent dehydrogenase (short-subunit alcohol dehydrogenase family)
VRENKHAFMLLHARVTGDISYMKIRREIMSMDRQIVVVIGGSSGIGYEVARQTLAQGALLTIIGSNPAKLAATADHLGGEVKKAVLDAHEDMALENFFSRLEVADHLVSMVGDSMSGGFLTTTPETMRHVLHSKFWTNWLIGKHVASKLRDGGSITFTAGTGGGRRRSRQAMSPIWA